MVNYYNLLGVNQEASENEIRRKLKERKRIWTQRQNAPKPEQQQEASNSLRLVPDIEATLLNTQKRNEYDQKLKTSPKEEEKFEIEKIKSEELIQEGWQLLSVGNVADALAVATKATEQQGDNADAWALLGYARSQWGDNEDAIYEYKRAIKLKPNNASFYFDLGGIYESTEQWNDAIQQYERAAKIDPSETVYKAAMGSVFIKNEMYSEGIGILEDCLKNDPDNNGYKYLLTVAYAESSYQNWTFVPAGGPVESGFYATTNEQVMEAERLCEKARGVGALESDVKKNLDQIAENISSMRKRRFHGNWLMPGGGIILGILIMGSNGLIGFLYFVSGVLYVFACLTPQYRLNLRLIEGREETSTGFIRDMGRDEGTVWGRIGASVFGLVLLAAFIPVMTAWNFIKNYAIK